MKDYKNDDVVLIRDVNGNYCVIDKNTISKLLSSKPNLLYGVPISGYYLFKQLLDHFNIKKDIRSIKKFCEEIAERLK